MIRSNLEPFIHEDTKLIILGTFPSVTSRGIWYYNNSKNQFWNIISLIFNNKSILSKKNESNDNALINLRKNFLKKKKIGLWDMIESCEIKNSDDNSITNPKYNNIVALKEKCPNLECIAFSSKKAFKYYKQYLNSVEDIDIKNWLNTMTNNDKNILPSPSPANVRIKLNDKKDEWYKVLQFLKS